MSKQIEAKLAKKGHSNPSKGLRAVQFANISYLMTPAFLKGVIKYAEILMKQNYYAIRHPNETDFGYETDNDWDEDESIDEKTMVRQSVRSLEKANRFFQQAISNARSGQNPHIAFKKAIEATSEAYDLSFSELVWFDETPPELDRLLSGEGKSYPKFFHDIGLYL